MVNFLHFGLNVGTDRCILKEHHIACFAHAIYRGGIKGWIYNFALLNAHMSNPMSVCPCSGHGSLVPFVIALFK